MAGKASDGVDALNAARTVRAKATALAPACGGARGLSLIEALVVTAIMAIVLGAALPSWARFIDARRLDSVAGELLADLQWVRTEAVMRNLPLRLTFQNPAFGDCYVVHTGRADACTCRAQGPAQCEAGTLMLKTVQLDTPSERTQVRANTRSLLFDPAHGTSTPTGTARVIGRTGREVRHIVNVMGRSRSCSPADAASHVPAYVNC